MQLFFEQIIVSMLSALKFYENVKEPHRMIVWYIFVVSFGFRSFSLSKLGLWFVF